MAIIGIPSTRVSDQFVRQRLLNQVQGDQISLFRLQTQLSTGHSFQLPSEAPIAAQRIMSLQRLLERKVQVDGNLNTNQSFLNASDVALSQIAGMMNEARGAALSVFGTTADDTQRRTAAQQVEQTLSQLLDAGNQQFRGRYLFAGSDTTMVPFDVEGGAVRYNGNENRLSSFADVDLLFDTNLQGNEVFGAISDEVQGRALEPVVTWGTRLVDLYGGKGISRGKIQITDGTGTPPAEIDLSNAETVGDLAELFHANAPPGKTIEVDIIPTGLVLSIDAGNLIISDVGSGTSALELGIRRDSGSATPSVRTRDFEPRLTKTTRLEDILGYRSVAVLRPGSSDNNIVFQADVPDANLNGVTISLIDDPATRFGASIRPMWDPVGKTLQLNIDSGDVEVGEVIDAVNADPAIPFHADLDPLDDRYGGRVMMYVDGTTAVTDYGQATLPEGAFDQASGLIITNNGVSQTVEIADCVTVEDLLNRLNLSEAGVLAEINEDATGINVRSRLSGSDFMIGEDGGQTATHLGLRTLVDSTKLADMNFGRGVSDYEGPGRSARATLSVAGENNDLLIESIAQGAEWNGVKVNFTGGAGPVSVTWDPVARQIDVNYVAGETTAQEVIDVFNATPGAKDFFRISLGPELQGNTGRGLVADISATTREGTLANMDFSITRNDGVTFEIDVHGIETAGGLIAAINSHALNVGPPSVVARQAINGNGIELVDGTLGTQGLSVTRAPGSIAAIDLGLIPAGQESAQGTAIGGEIILQGGDVNRKETYGLFTALLRLQDGLERNDVGQMERAIQMLDDSTVNMTFARAELGARQQGLDVLQSRLEGEGIDLRSTMSADYDVDIAEVISNLSAKQVAYEASLKSVAQVAQMTLLNYL